MDWLTFFSNILTAWAWPTAVILVVLLLRRELPSLARRLNKLKAGSLELEFEREVQKLESKAEESGILPPQAKKLRPDSEPLLAAAARGSILQAYAEVEAALRYAAAKIKPDAANRPDSALEVLLVSGRMTDEQADLFKSMRELRNAAAHVADFNPDPSAVERYLRLATAFRALLVG